MIDMTKQDVDTLAHVLLYKIEDIIEDNEQSLGEEYEKTPTVEAEVLYRVASLLNLYAELAFLQRPDGCSDPFDNTLAAALAKLRADVCTFIELIQEDFNV